MKKLSLSAALVLTILFSAQCGAAAKPDLSSPKKAALAFATGLRLGDLDMLRSSSVGTADDYKMMEAMASMMGAAGKLHDAAAARFGPKEADKVAGPITGNADAAREIEQSQEKVDGDTATIVTPKGPANALQLKKIDGDWRIDLTRFPQRSELVRQIPMYSAMQKVLSQGAADISSGKYRSAEDAGQEITGRLAAVAASVARQQKQ